jgi:DNA-damage-inducible protein D
VENESAAGSPFAALRQTTPEGGEYWSARALAPLLGYRRWENFRAVLDRAMIAAANSEQDVADHFRATTQMITAGKGARRAVEDFDLSRYACYLAVQNADPSKEIVALGQTYFAVQTQRQEQADALAGLSEAEQRLYLRQQLKDHNMALAAAARQAGVIEPQDFAIFQDHGYIGLYGGLRARDIHRRKGLKKSQGILDHMGSTELAANLFRATQTRDKLAREGVADKAAANETHFEVGQEVRATIGRLGGTLPENAPTPDESIQQLERRERKRLQQGPQTAMFSEDAPDPPPDLAALTRGVPPFTAHERRRPTPTNASPAGGARYCPGHDALGQRRRPRRSADLRTRGSRCGMRDRRFPTRAAVARRAQMRRYDSELRRILDATLRGRGAMVKWRLQGLPIGRTTAGVSRNPFQVSIPPNQKQ